MSKLSKLNNQNLPFNSPIINQFLEHQIEISGSILSVIGLGYLAKVEAFKPFFELKGALPNGTYDKHINDFYFVVLWFLIFIFVRTLVMDRILVPYIKSCGVKNTVIQQKFKEQGFMCGFYILSWTYGMYLLSKEDYAFDLSKIVVDYPFKTMSFAVKQYYLVQMAFWLNQMYFIQLEFKRKDYVAMLVHHILTNFLIVNSYLANHTGIGHAILVVMDFADIFLTGAKVLNYLKYKFMCDMTFVLFVLSWVVTRHVIFVKIIWNLIKCDGTENYRWEPQNGHFMSRPVLWTFIIFLSGLEVLCVIWFSMIAKILYHIVKAGKVVDVRSDDEEDEEVTVQKEISLEKKAL